MTQVALTIATAFASGDRACMESIAAAQRPGTAVRAVAVCLVDFLAYNAQSDTGNGPMPEALSAAIDRALAVDPGDSDLLMCVLCVAVHRAFAIPDMASCERLVARAHALAPHCQLLRSRAIPWRLDCWLGIRHDDVARRLRACDGIASLPGIDGDADLSLEFAYKRVVARISDHDLAGLEDAIDALLTHCEACRARLHVDPAWLRPAYWLLCGEYERVLGCHAEELVGSLRDAGQLDIMRLSALLGLGRLDEVDAGLAAYQSLLKECGEWGCARSDRVALFHETAFVRELIVARFEEARRHLRLATASIANPHRYHKRCMHLALAFELAVGEVARARACLEKLDPNAARGDLHMEWCRLHLLEGDQRSASACFARAQAKGHPGYLEHTLLFAHEMRAHQSLWLARQHPVAPRSVPPRPPATPARTVLLGDSPAMAAVRSQIRTLAPLPHTVLITGETGTGKECVARLLHEQGAHPQEPFLPLNCAALPDALAESELFGHRRGAFTGADRDAAGLIAAAGTGTIFLDEIASMSQRLQGVLLRVLETGDYRPVGGQRQRRSQARFVVASNRSLAEAVAAGEFRPDLYYRLERFTIALPPLRTRREDIPVLCDHFVAAATGVGELRISEELLARLRAHDWPGNVRELRNEIERLAILNPSVDELGSDGSLIPCATASHPPHAPIATTDASSDDDDDDEDYGLPGTPRARRRRTAIMRLVRTRQRLYRAEVIEELGCAPATATRDLRVLEECGVIRRVETSAHLRTSYFVVTDPPASS